LFLVAATPPVAAAPFCSAEREKERERERERERNRVKEEGSV